MNTGYYAFNFPEGLEDGMPYNEFDVDQSGVLRCNNRNLQGGLATNALYIDCGENAIEWISANSANEINCKSNRLTHLHLPNAACVDCSKNSLLRRLHLPVAEELYCKLCRIDSLTDLELPKVRRLHAEWCGLRAVKLSHCRLAELYCNRIEELYLPQAHFVDVSFNELLKPERVIVPPYCLLSVSPPDIPGINWK